MVNNEKVLCVIKTSKNIKNSSVIANIFTNLALSAFGGVAEDIPSIFKLTLTEKDLYVEAIGNSTFGNLPETRNIDKISRKNIKEFNVESNGDQEIIKLINEKNKSVEFIRDNSKHDDLAQQMKNIINQN